MFPTRLGQHILLVAMVRHYLDMGKQQARDDGKAADRPSIGLTALAEAL